MLRRRCPSRTPCSCCAGPLSLQPCAFPVHGSACTKPQSSGPRCAMSAVIRCSNSELTASPLPAWIATTPHIKRSPDSPSRRTLNRPSCFHMKIDSPRPPRESFRPPAMQTTKPRVGLETPRRRVRPPSTRIATRLQWVVSAAQRCARRSEASRRPSDSSTPLTAAQCPPCA